MYVSNALKIYKSIKKPYIEYVFILYKIKISIYKLFSIKYLIFIYMLWFLYDHITCVCVYIVYYIHIYVIIVYNNNI